jgi:DoxX-like family
VGARPVAELNSDALVTSRGMFRTGWAVTGVVGLFLLVDGGARLAGFAPYVEGMTKFGYAASLAPWIGLVLLLSTILMLIPQTAALGSILVTGYLGGATATQVREQDAWLLFPVMLGVMSWLGLYLRDARVRALIPFRTGYR